MSELKFKIGDPVRDKMFGQPMVIERVVISTTYEAVDKHGVKRKYAADEIEAANGTVTA